MKVHGIMTIRELCIGIDLNPELGGFCAFVAEFIMVLKKSFMDEKTLQSAFRVHPCLWN